MDNSVSWEQLWNHCLITNHATNPGWVALLLFPRKFTTTDIVITERPLLDLLGTVEARPYTQLIHLIPVRLVENKETQNFISKQQLNTKSERVRCERIADDVETLSQRLTAIPERSIVFIHRIDSYHATDTRQKSNLVHTWSGSDVNITTRDEQLGQQVGAVVEHLLVIAQSQNLLIVAYAELSTYAADYFKDSVKNAPQLCILGGHRLEDRYFTLVSKLLSRTKSGKLSLDRARARARRATQDPILQAQGETQLLLAHQHFDEAWRTIEPHLADYMNAPSGICLSVARMPVATWY